jgi:hypothetical protein
LRCSVPVIKIPLYIACCYSKKEHYQSCVVYDYKHVIQGCLLKLYNRHDSLRILRNTFSFIVIYTSELHKAVAGNLNFRFALWYKYSENIVMHFSLFLLLCMEKSCHK